MSYNPVRALRRDLRNAYEAHDHVAFEEHLDRMERMFSYTGPPPPPPHRLLLTWV